LDDVRDVRGKRELASAIYETVEAGRNLRAESNLPSNRKIHFILRSDSNSISGHIPALIRLLNAEDMVVDPKYQMAPGNPVAVTPLGEILLAISAADKTRERERLDKATIKIANDLRGLEAKLQNSSFIDRAPASVVEDHRRRLKDLSGQLAKLEQARAGRS